MAKKKDDKQGAIIGYLNANPDSDMSGLDVIMKAFHANPNADPTEVVVEALRAAGRNVTVVDINTPAPAKK